MTILSSAPLQPDVKSRPDPESLPVARTGDDSLVTLSNPDHEERHRTQRGGLWVSAVLAVLAGVALLQGAILVGLLLVAALSVLLLAGNQHRWAGLQRGGGGGWVPDGGSSSGSSGGQSGECGASDGGSGGGCGD
ncbi:hypothetical protein [Deinococcus koreensis]|uniref:Uncharacterized protein n=1 Tax=Deinococcus koreensis TaxID=2054903 RepID=A0A2K3V1E7_9DEIO|nr:hypothetical protein [Deinococcus koreensis]PNY82612.1 hypothetical protein CVO96_15760 [Deinococcus koreensis]